MHRGIFIICAGGHARVCAEVAEAMGLAVLGFIDSLRRPGEKINGKSLPFCTLGELKASRRHDGGTVFIAESHNAKRLILCDEARALGFELPPLVHPSAFVAPSASIGDGTVLLPGAIVHTSAHVGRACILNTASSIDHDSVVEDGAQICPGVHAGGGVRYGTQCFVGVGASIKPGVTIGSRAIIGAGAAVIRDVAPDTTVVGNPARPLIVSNKVNRAHRR